MHVLCDIRSTYKRGTICSIALQPSHHHPDKSSKLSQLLMLHLHILADMKILSPHPIPAIKHKDNPEYAITTVSPLNCRKLLSPPALTEYYISCPVLVKSVNSMARTLQQLKDSMYIYIYIEREWIVYSVSSIDNSALLIWIHFLLPFPPGIHYQAHSLEPCFRQEGVS